MIVRQVLCSSTNKPRQWLLVEADGRLDPRPYFLVYNGKERLILVLINRFGRRQGIGLFEEKNALGNEDVP